MISFRKLNSLIRVKNLFDIILFFEHEFLNNFLCKNIEIIHVNMNFKKKLTDPI